MVKLLSLMRNNKVNDHDYDLGAMGFISWLPRALFHTNYFKGSMSFNLTTTPWAMYYRYLHFTDEEVGSEWLAHGH